MAKPSLDSEKAANRWGGPYAKKEQLKDAWGRTLKYELAEVGESGKKVPRISSSGPDGEEGTDDDIKFWSDEESAEEVFPS